MIGGSAERHGLVTQRNGASRYTRDYYGVFAAAALGGWYERGGEITVFGSHPSILCQARESAQSRYFGLISFHFEGVT